MEGRHDLDCERMMPSSFYDSVPGLLFLFLCIGLLVAVALQVLVVEAQLVAVVLVVLVVHAQLVEAQLGGLLLKKG